jgi:hypothetical protein
MIEMYQEEDAIIYPGDHKEVEKKLMHIRTCNFIWMHWMAENVPCWKYIANCCCNNYDQYYEDCKEFIDISMEEINRLMSVQGLMAANV